MGQENFINWGLGTRIQFDAVTPVGTIRSDAISCQRPRTAPPQEWARAIAPHGQRTVTGGASGGDAGSSSRFRQLSNTAKLGVALASATAALGPEARAKFDELRSPANLAIMAGALAIWIGAQATPIGWVVNIGMAGLGVVALGAEAIDVIQELHAFGMGVITANSEAELVKAGGHLAKAIAIVGVDMVIALLLKKATVKLREPNIKASDGSGKKLFGKYEVESAAKSLPKENKALPRIVDDAVAAPLAYKPTSGVALKAQQGKTTTILGSYNNDMGSVVREMGNVKNVDFGPKQGAFNVLNVPDNLYVSPKQFWQEYNQPWLSKAIARGDKFLMATRPAFDVTDVKTGAGVLARPNPVTGKMELSGFGREYLELRRAGYTFKDGMMVK